MQIASKVRPSIFSNIKTGELEPRRCRLTDSNFAMISQDDHEKKKSTNNYCRRTTYKDEISKERRRIKDNKETKRG